MENYMNYILYPFAFLGLLFFASFFTPHHPNENGQITECYGVAVY